MTRSRKWRRDWLGNRQCVGSTRRPGSHRRRKRHHSMVRWTCDSEFLFAVIDDIFRGRSGYRSSKRCPRGISKATTGYRRGRGRGRGRRRRCRRFRFRIRTLDLVFQGSNNCDSRCSGDDISGLHWRAWKVCHRGRTSIGAGTKRLRTLGRLGSLKIEIGRTVRLVEGA